MKVLHVIPSVAPQDGGPSAAVLGMCDALRRRGVETLVATTDADGRRRLAVQRDEPTTFAGVPVIFFARESRAPFKWSRSLARWLNGHAGAYDLVHVHAVFSHAVFAAGRACQASGVPYLVRPLGSLDPWSVSQKEWRKRFALRLGLRGVLSQAAAIHYTTQEEQRLAEGRFPFLPPGVEVPIGIHDEFFLEAGSPASEPYALCLSRLEPKKRLEWVIDAAHALAAKGAMTAWRVVIAGEGDADYAARLRQAADRGPAAPRIAFAGWASGARKLELIRGASLFLLPSHQENLGIAMIEAMASGVPPVVTPGVNLGREMSGAGAGWMAGDDPTAFLSCLEGAMADDDARAERGRRARAFAERFRWSVVADRLTEVYAAVVEHRMVGRPGVGLRASGAIAVSNH